MKLNKKIVLALLIAILIITLGYFLFFRQNGPKKSLVTETKPVFINDIKNLHWLDNQDLGYTFFDPETKRRAIAKTNGINEDVLLRDPKLKLSEVFWSVNNDLLIFEYGVPYTTYLFNHSRKLSQLPIAGYGFSWSPDGKSFFYQPDISNTTPEPKIYHLDTKKEEPISMKLPSFNASYWSPTSSQIALYNYDMEKDAGSLSMFDLESKSVNPFTQKQLFPPRWSPGGKSIAYLTTEGIYVYSGQKENLVYKTSSSPQYVSFVWINDQRLLAFDLDQKRQVFQIGIDDSSKSESKIMPELKTNQQLQLELSPDGETLAVATEKDGLWFVKNKDFLQN